MSEPLGPAVTDDFPAAVGLHELLDGHEPQLGAPPPPPATPPIAPAPVPVELPPDLLRNTLTIFDAILSHMVLRVETEPREIIEQLERNLRPLAEYYAQGHPTVAVLWTGAAIALAGYGYAKYERVAERRAKERAAAAASVPLGPDASH